MLRWLLLLAAEELREGSEQALLVAKARGGSNMQARL